MTRWQFDNGSSVVTVANDSSSVTYDVPSLSTEHTGVYYCEAITDGMTDTSMNFILFGEWYMVQAVDLFIVCDSSYLAICLSEGISVTHRLLQGGCDFVLLLAP